MTVPAWSEPRTAIVTGGGQGIGEAICRRLAADGAAVAVLDIQESNAASTAAAIEAEGGRALALGVDVSDRGAIEAAVSEITTALGPPLILVNNAGITPFERFLDIGREDFQRVIEVNVFGTFEFCQVVLPHMIDAGWGRIVNISSSSAQTGSARQTHYAASKGAVVAFTKSLAREVGRKGITVNTVPPGFVETPSLHAAEDEGYVSIEAATAMVPVNRVGQPEDIAAACAYLVRDDAGFITGQVIGVNGGRVTG